MASTAGDSRRNKRLRDQALEDRSTERNLIQAMMSDARSRRWIWLRLQEAAIFQAVWPLDQLELAFREGRRQAGLALLAQVMEWAPLKFAEMYAENSLAQVKEKEEYERDSRSGDDPTGDAG